MWSASRLGAADKASAQGSAGASTAVRQGPWGVAEAAAERYIAASAWQNGAGAEQARIREVHLTA